MSNRDYSIRQMLEMEACTQCRLCADVCPAVSASSDGVLSALSRMKGLKEVLKSRTALFRGLFRKRGPSEEEWKKFERQRLPVHSLRQLPGSLSRGPRPQEPLAFRSPGHGAFRQLSEENRNGSR